jgi:hypothetical protein
MTKRGKSGLMAPGDGGWSRSAASLDMGRDVRLRVAA